MWRNGRRNGLKIRWEQSRAGSSPATGITSQTSTYNEKTGGRNGVGAIIVSLKNEGNNPLNIKDLSIAKAFRKAQPVVVDLVAK